MTRPKWCILTTRREEVGSCWFNRIATLYDARAPFIPNPKALVAKLFHQRVLIEASLKRCRVPAENGLLTLLLTRPEITQTWIFRRCAKYPAGFAAHFRAYLSKLEKREVSTS